MKLKALALDYDGTIAEEGRLVPEVRTAIAHARERGLIVLIVTGRILRDLRGAAGDLAFADAIVAENGAVVVFPASGRSRVLHDAPSSTLLDELRRRGVEIEVGEVVIEAEAAAGPATLEAIRNIEQPLALHFNRSRMMYRCARLPTIPPSKPAYPSPTPQAPLGNDGWRRADLARSRG